MSVNEEFWHSGVLPPAKQFRGFQEVLDRTHFHWGLKSPQPDLYQAKVLRRCVDDYVLTHVVADPLSGKRSVSDIHRDTDQHFCLLFLEAGDIELRQGHNVSQLHTGSVALWDGSRPAEFHASTPVRQLSVLIPQRIATTVMPGIEAVCGLSVDGNHGLGAILLSHLRQLHQTIHEVEPTDRPAVLRATVELASAAFRPNNLITSGSAWRRALLQNVQDYILAHLGDANLGPQSIAAHFRFSPRYLHRLFEEFDYTVSDWIRKRRLLAGQSELADPARDAEGITQIAMRYGFCDAAHFSRAFKGEFGLSPRDFRQSLRRTDH
jgi:AraC-like DNA-binding protein